MWSTSRGADPGDDDEGLDEGYHVRRVRRPNMTCDPFLT